MLTASEVAALLNVSPAWVYRHKHALGGFQLDHCGAVRFSENHIEAIKEGKINALYDAQREVAGKAHDTRSVENKGIPDQGRGKTMGSGTNPRQLAASRDRDPYGLLA